MYCAKCHKPTREIVPVMVSPPAKAFDQNRVIPRAAMWALNPEAEAALPWGQHPDDDRFQSCCRDCAEKAAA